MQGNDDPPIRPPARRALLVERTCLLDRRGLSGPSQRKGEKDEHQPDGHEQRADREQHDAHRRDLPGTKVVTKWWPTSETTKPPDRADRRSPRSEGPSL